MAGKQKNLMTSALDYQKTVDAKGNVWYVATDGARFKCLSKLRKHVWTIAASGGADR